MAYAKRGPRYYTFRVHWSAEDGEYVATLEEYPSLSWLGPTPKEAFAGLLHVLTVDLLTPEESTEDVTDLVGKEESKDERQ